MLRKALPVAVASVLGAMNINAVLAAATGGSSVEFMGMAPPGSPAMLARMPRTLPFRHAGD